MPSQLQTDRISCGTMYQTPKNLRAKTFPSALGLELPPLTPTTTGQIRHSQGGGETEQEPAAAVAHPARPGVCKCKHVHEYASITHTHEHI